MIRQTLGRMFREQSFHPTLLGVFVNPFFIARRGLASAVREFAHPVRGRLLDVGCGTKPYERFFQVEQYVGLDIESARTRASAVADHYYDGRRFPFVDCSFDAVLCNQVLEHVFNPHEFVAEMHRVLKPGGQLVLTVPFVWDEHEQPFDYARYSSFGLRALFEENGFVIERHKKINANVSVIFQLMNAYLYKILPKPLIVHLIVCATMMAPISFLGVILSKILPDNQDLYLDQIILAKKLTQ
jgi:SAM-dependent methyltransferase